MTSTKLLECLQKQEKLSTAMGDATLGAAHCVVHDDPTNGFRYKFSKAPNTYIMRVRPMETGQAHMVYGPRAARGIASSGEFNVFHNVNLGELVDIVMELRRLN